MALPDGGMGMGEATLIIVAFILKHWGDVIIGKRLAKKTAVASAETQGKVDAASTELKEDLSGRLTALEKKVDDDIKKNSASRAAAVESFEEIRSRLGTQNVNMKRIAQRVGVEWTEDVTLVKEPKKS